MTYSSFDEEIISDAEGNFSFLGVPAGIYTLMSKGLDNQVYRLATIEMPQQDVFNVNLNLQEELTYKLLENMLNVE